MSGRRRLIYALEYPLAYGGGVSAIVRHLLEGLQGEFELGLVSPDTPESLAQAGLDGLIAVHLPWHPGPASRASAQALADRIAAWAPAIVHFHAGGNYGWGNRRPGTSPLPRLRRRGIVCVTTVHLVVSRLHHATPQHWPKWLQAAAWPLAWLGKLSALSATTREIAVSEHDLGLLRRWYGPARAKFERIYHSRLPEKSALPAPQSAHLPVILHVGHRALRKGQHRLVEAFCAVASRHPGWRLRLAGPPGDATFEEHLSETIRRHGLESRVEILPAQTETEVAALMREAAVYVQPSLEEALGLALQEALFQGCACIGTRAGGIPELIDHECNGLLCAADDADSLGRALDLLLSEPSLRESFAAAGPASLRSRGMSAEEMVRQHRRLYALVSP